MIATFSAVRSALGGQLRSLVLFGSCLSEATARAGSIPDLFAVVDDLDDALKTLGVSAAGRLIAPALPPVTLAFDGLAKLNVVDVKTLTRELHTPTDLYLAGRLGKRTECVYARDASCRREIDALRETARRLIARVALLGLPRLTSLEAVLRRCVGLSYEAEPRPEKPEKIRALYDAFADWYPPRYTPLIAEHARAMGVVLAADALIDQRDDAVRAKEAKGLRRLIRKSWFRAMARWPKGVLLYRGWLPYLVGKITRARTWSPTGAAAPHGHVSAVLRSGHEAGRG